MQKKYRYLVRFFQLTLAVVASSLGVQAQVYNNEWIDYSKTYYKFKISSDGLYRLPAALLQANGLENVPVTQFRLFRNGQEVALYTSVSAGSLPADGYIEFVGKANDGGPDRGLYRSPSYQHTQRYSLFNDTATYFLTVDPNGAGKRFATVVNNVAANSLPAEPYFMYTYGNYYKAKINPGLANIIEGNYFYSSGFDLGEYWSSADIREKTSLNDNATNLQVAASGPNVSFRFGVSGNTYNTRRAQLSVNSQLLKDTAMNYFSSAVLSTSFSPSVIASNTAAISFTNYQPPAATNVDRMVVSFYEMTYPRLFSFNNTTWFPFTLDARSQGYYLEITNFNAGGAAPVLYDTETMERYDANTEVTGVYRFALRGSITARNMVLVSRAAGNIKTVAALQPKTFVNLNSPDNRGNFLIISNKVLYNGANGRNPVEEYRSYRSSAAGGSYNAKIYDIDELTDQFAFGVYGHPSAVKNFISYARDRFGGAPKAFIIGKGVLYNQYWNSPTTERPRLREQNMVPTFGHPGSDNMLATSSTVSPVALTEIGRLSVINGDEVLNYLEKVIEYEQAQHAASNRIADKLWMKNVLHVTGATDALLGTALCSYVNAYKTIIDDTLTGANTTVLCKAVSGTNDQAGGEIARQKIEEGISLLTYFGHSSASTLEFSISDPNDYNNAGKYPVFSVNGCYAGNFFDFSNGRFETWETLSEKYVLTRQRGAIAFIASTHFGVTNYLHHYLNSFYTRIAKTNYGTTVCDASLKSLADLVNETNNTDYLARAHAEQITYHGDPALVLNFQAKPDYVVEASSIRLDPGFISIADQQYKLSVTIYNQGKATADSVSVEISRVSPAGVTTTLFNQKMAPINLADSVVLTIPIDALKDKGQNIINVKVDGANLVDEMDETNNYATRSYFIYEDEASPVFPYNYAIINDPSFKYYASTANPISTAKQYILEVDTTKLFNSPLKRSTTISSPGGVLEFDPQMSYIDSTVYYWRTSFVPGEGGEYKWSNFSFLFNSRLSTGFNQSHYFQHKESDLSNIVLDSARKWQFSPRLNSMVVKQAMYPTSGSQDMDFSIELNNFDSVRSACVGQSLLFNIIDPVSFRPWKNVDASGNNLYRYGSGSANCHWSRNWNFEFSYMSDSLRGIIMQFMDSIPVGSFVIVRSFDYDVPRSYASTWLGDTARFGRGNSLYHRLLAAGLTGIDSINAPKCWAMVYQKGVSSFTPVYKISQGLYDKVFINLAPETPGVEGTVHSPEFGPARSWEKMVWRGHPAELTNSPDNASIGIYGITPANAPVLLKTVNMAEWDNDISDIDAAQYPRLRLKLHTLDSINHSPYQLDYWRLIYQPVPEGAIAPNIYLVGKDTVEYGEQMEFAVAFKNISKTAFDSLQLKFILTDASNVPHQLAYDTVKPLVSGDTVVFRITLNSTNYPGSNVLYVDFNPDNAQPEQYHFNNILYKPFFVRVDKNNPLLDVTFDGVHILNGDIVSAKPTIVIKLKDENKHLLLTNDSLMRIQVKYPDQSVRTFKVDGDTVRFTPASSGADNTATIEFMPAFMKTFDEETGIDNYQLTVTGRDNANNPAGKVQYNVNFTVINKPMISNLLNYPNPFSTSTAFVFTLTGSEIPTNFKIQILTVTGKVVREITGPELGPLRIGRNITEFKWDGTDQFGQRLANGVYLYRVITMLNGKTLEKFKAQNDNTDKFFNKGYGKMYLIR